MVLGSHVAHFIFSISTTSGARVWWARGVGKEHAAYSTRTLSISTTPGASMWWAKGVEQGALGTARH